MKKVKTILLRGIFYLLALQILNLSIDLDYLAFNFSKGSGIAASFDDIDSIGEYIIEKIICDNNFTSEDDNDDGNPQNKGLEKYDSSPLYAEQFSKPKIANSNHKSLWFKGLDLANKTCKGYFNIITPPPKA